MHAFYDNTIMIISTYDINCLQALIIIHITVDLSAGFHSVVENYNSHGLRRHARLMVNHQIEKSSYNFYLLYKKT